MADSVTKVFNTPELLETILLNFSPFTMGTVADPPVKTWDALRERDEKDRVLRPDRAAGMRQLLRCQRVSKGFRDGIASSPQLQMALFLKPARRSLLDRCADVRRSGGKPMLNPLLDGHTVTADFVDGDIYVSSKDEYLFGHRKIYHDKSQGRGVPSKAMDDIPEISSTGQNMLLQQPQQPRVVPMWEIVRQEVGCHFRDAKRSRVKLKRSMTVGKLLRDFFGFQSKGAALGG